MIDKNYLISRFNLLLFLIILSCNPNTETAPEGMVWIPGGTFYQGALESDSYAMNHEKPRHEVKVNGFFMDITEVTNKDFKKFVDQTNYITVAERKVEWEEIKSQLPENTTKPHDSILQPGSLVFKKTKIPLKNLNDFFQWWKWKIGASWLNVTGENDNYDNISENLPAHSQYANASM